MPTSVHLNSEKESHAKEPLESNLSNNDLTSPEEQIHNPRLKNPGMLVCAHLNINSLKNKFDLLTNIVKDKIDILMISETKLDSSFPKGQFHLHGFSEPSRLDRNGNGGGMLVFIREDIPSNLIEPKMKIEGSFVELNLKRKKGLLSCSYNPKFSQISFHLNELRKNFDTLTSKYDNIIILGDFNTEPTDTALPHFCEICNFKNLIKDIQKSKQNKLY